MRQNTPTATQTLWDYLDGQELAPSTRYQAAQAAHDYLKELLTSPVLRQEEVLTKMTRSFLENLNFTVVSDLALAIVAATLEEVVRSWPRNLTASEKISTAVEVLEGREDYSVGL